LLCFASLCLYLFCLWLLVVALLCFALLYVALLCLYLFCLYLFCLWLLVVALLCVALLCFVWELLMEFAKFVKQCPHVKTSLIWSDVTSVDVCSDRICALSEPSERSGHLCVSVSRALGLSVSLCLRGCNLLRKLVDLRLSFKGLPGATCHVDRIDIRSATGRHRPCDMKCFSSSRRQGLFSPFETCSCDSAM
jgi:hypothetical protein